MIFRTQRINSLLKYRYVKIFAMMNALLRLVYWAFGSGLNAKSSIEMTM